MTLTKAEIVDGVASKLGWSKGDTLDFVDSVFEQFKITLSQGQPVHISGFGNFPLRDKKERPGRNPKTGEEIKVSARRVVTFHCGHKLQDSIAENMADK